MKLMVRLVEEVTTPQMRGRRECKGNCLPVGGGPMHGTLVKHSLIAWVMGDNEWL